MNKKKWKRKSFFANKLHRKIFLLIGLAAIVPSLITGVFLYYLIFYTTADQIGIPENVAFILIPAAQRVLTTLVIVVPIAIGLILFWAYVITHRIVGPFDRIVREVEECVRGEYKGPIVLRKKDKLWHLVNQINQLIKKLEV